MTGVFAFHGGWKTIPIRFSGQLDAARLPTILLLASDAEAVGELNLSHGQLIPVNTAKLTVTTSDDTRLLTASSIGKSLVEESEVHGREANAVIDSSKAG
ncbi:MAG: hypothetical protein KDA91_02760 [Planctomycetaceae bacterium]|nr:hypothetical protein [Planctomycetaceae bacterium]